MSSIHSFIHYSFGEKVVIASFEKSQVFVEGIREMCKGENPKHFHCTPGQPLLAFWCYHEGILAPWKKTIQTAIV